MSIKNMKYIILGSGIAGMAAAEAIRGIDADGEILMISAEKELCFNRPMLIQEFALDGSGAALFEKQQGWPDQFGVTVRLGLAADGINREKKQVRLSDGTCESYDKLIYTLGAEVTVPPIPGADLDTVHVVRTRDDMKQIRSAMKSAKSAVVIGGGMLGLEDAWALREQKLDVAIIEQKQRVAFGQIDQSAGNLMKKRIERMGVPVYVNSAVTEIGDGYVTFRQEEPENNGVKVSAGISEEASEETGAGCESCEGCPARIEGKVVEEVTIPADLVILSTGVTPNSALGEKAGLMVTGKDACNKGSRPEEDIYPCEGSTVVLPSESGPRWIAVDEQCRTSDPDIFAAGDAAAVNGRNDAIWDEAREMGRVAGSNAALEALGDKVVQTYYPLRYEPVTPEHVFTGFDTEIFTMADSSGAGTDGVYIRHADVEIFDYQRERYIRASLQDGLLAGVLLINASELAPEMIDAYKRKATEEEVRQIIKAWKDSHEVDFKPAATFKHR